MAFLWPSVGRADNSVGVQVDIDRGILPAGSPQKAIIKVTLDPPPAPKKGNLSARELQLLKLFYTHPNEVLNRDQLLNLAWGIEYYGTTRTLDQHIAQLRKKVEHDPAHPSVIVTVHGIGYRYQKPA